MPFLDIFSKKREKEIKKVNIIIDYREKNSLVASELSSLGFQIEFKHLLVGDYLVNDIAIERKTFSDLQSSIINKRIISQLFHLKQYQKNLLVIEGFEEPYSKIIHENALRGFILSIALEYKVPIKKNKNSKDTANYLSVLAKKSPKKDFSLRASRFLETKEEQAQFILEGFPTIGPITAKKLLNNFKSLNNIVNASEEELTKIVGRKASAIKAIIDYRINTKDNI